MKMKISCYVTVTLLNISCCTAFSAISNKSSSRSPTSLKISGDDHSNGVPPTTAQQEADKLRDQARRIREQLAQLQQKSFEEVEIEALNEKKKSQFLQTGASEGKDTQLEDSKKRLKGSLNRIVALPETAEEQIRQASLAIERAFADGITRQTVRLALVRKNQLISSDEDEWPGGTKEMFREAGRPLSEDLLFEVRAFSSKNITSASNSRYNFPPTIKTQDILDFDGSALITAESAIGSIGDIQAMVFANTDTKYINDIRDISKALGKDRLFMLINPFWKDIESWGIFNLLAPGAKRLAREVIFESEGGGFQETYALNRWTVRGEKVAAVKAYPYDWQLFAYLEDNTFGIPTETAVRLGSTADRPTTAIFTELLNSRPEFKINRTIRQIRKSF